LYCPATASLALMAL